MLSGEHLLRLLNDILDMSRLEAHALTLNPVSFNLAEFLSGKSSVVAIAHRAEGTGV